VTKPILYSRRVQSQPEPVPCKVCGAAPVENIRPHNIFPSGFRCPHKSDAAHWGKGQTAYGKTHVGAVNVWNRRQLELASGNKAAFVVTDGPRCPICSLLEPHVCYQERGGFQRVREVIPSMESKRGADAVGRAA
jgi:hypothetical protein